MIAKGKKKQMLNPILRKELRLGSRSIRLPLSVMFYDIVLAIVAVIAILVAALAGSSDGGVDFSGFLYIFQIIGWIQLGITLLIVPILTAGSISGEREKQTLEIMLTTPEKPLAIIWGKLLASLSNYLIFIISSIPIMAIAFVLGGLNWFALLGYIFMMIVVAIFVGSIGIFCSSAFKKTIVSIVMTFLLEFAVLAVPVFLFMGILGGGAVMYEYIYYESNYAGTIPDPNFGILPLIMIGNPLTGFLDYMLRVMDADNIAVVIRDTDIFGTIMPVIAHAWIPLNVLACGGISYFFLKMAAKKLNPIKKVKKKKQAPVPNPVQIPNQASAQGMPQMYQPQQETLQAQQTIPSQEPAAITEQLTQQMIQPQQGSIRMQQNLQPPQAEQQDPQEVLSQEPKAITEKLTQPGVVVQEDNQEQQSSPNNS